MLFFINATPVPKEIPLDLPLPEGILIVILVFSFILHILFVNLMFGGTLLTLWAQLKGCKKPEYDGLAHEIAKTITVNKSMAVVLGVAPLLSINVLYSIYFYASNALTGMMWIAIVPLVTVAFLLTYLHKYTWKTLEKHKGLHISIIALAAVIFMIIPLIFLVNVNLMLFPEKWGTVKGFLSALTLPNVFPRYFHFICSSLAITGLFLFWYVKRPSYDFEAHMTGLRRYDVLKISYSLAFGASALQFIVGPIVLLTLPSKGMGWNLVLTILSGVAFAIPAMIWMYRSLTGPESAIAKDFKKVVLFFTLTVLFMASGRHLYRQNALDPHREWIQKERRWFDAKSKWAREHQQSESASSGDPKADGAALFQKTCAACHKEKEKLVGPPVVEMNQIYGDDVAGFKKWVLNPGKKRPDYPQMPPFSALKDEQLDALHAYIKSVTN